MDHSWSFDTLTYFACLERERQLQAALPRIADFQEAFNLLNKCSRRHNLSLKKMGECLRAWGLNPTDEEVQRYGEYFSMRNEGGNDASSANITFINLLKVYHALAKQSMQLDPKHKANVVINGLRQLDSEGIGYLPIAELHRLLTDNGDKLSDAEFGELVMCAGAQDLDLSNGLVDYEQFVYRIMGVKCCPSTALSEQITQVEAYLSGLGYDYAKTPSLVSLKKPKKLIGSRRSSEVADYVDALRQYDKNNSGYIAKADLRHFLTSIGEKLSDDEFRLMIDNVGLKGERINYSRFVTMVMANI